MHLRSFMAPVDLLVITSSQDEMSAVFNLKEGGKTDWKSHQTPESHTYHSAEFSLDNKETFKVIAFCQHQDGPIAAAISSSNILSIINPKLVCLVGVCYGKYAEFLEIGDVITASQVFIYDVGKLKDNKFQPDLHVSVIHSYLQQWIQDFNHNNNCWFNDIKTSRPFSLRYQKEWLLFKLLEIKIPDLDWVHSQETSSNCPDWEIVFNALETEGLIYISDGRLELTNAGKEYLANLRIKKRQVTPLLDKPSPKAFYGSFASGNNDIQQVNFFDELVQRDRNVLAFDKEAAAFLKACTIKSISLPAFIVKGVYNHATGDTPNHFRKYAAETAAHYLINFVRQALPKLKALTQPKKVWDIPLETHYFTGRKEIIQELCDDLKALRTTAVTQGICGLGGIGKTQTARRLASILKNNYYYGFLVNAFSHADIIRGYSNIALKLNLYAETEDGLVNLVNNWFEEQDKWLVIFDNADNPKILKNFIPTKHQGHILITSRDNALEGCGVRKIIQLPVLTKEESRQFFLDRLGKEELPSDEEDSLNQLGKNLGYLPLALEQAAAFIKTRETSFRSYLKSFTKVKIELFKDKELTEKESVATTWEINFREVENNLAAKDLLYSIAFLAPDNIPFKLLEIGGQSLSPAIANALQRVEKNTTLVNSLLYPLTKYSLIQINSQNSTFSIHRLVQEVIKDKLSDEAQKTCFTNITQALLISFPQSEYEDNPLCNILIPHIKTLAGYSEEKKIFTEKLGLLFNDSGYYCHQRTKLMDAEFLSNRALDTLEKVFGRSHFYTAQTINNLGGIFNLQGKHEKAEALFKEALQIYGKVLDEFHPHTATALNNLAALYKELARYDEAEALLKRAFQICQIALGDFHPNTADTLNNLAGVFQAQSKYKEAEPLYKKALEARKKISGDFHPNTATSFNNLALLYIEQARYKEAEPLLKQAVEIYKRALGDFHPDTAQSLGNLALLYKDLCQYEQAESLLKESLQIYENSLGRFHPDTANVISNLGLLYKDQFRYDEAEPLLKEALDIRKKILGEFHPDTANTLNNLGILYKSQRRYEEAEPLYKQALKIRKTVLGDSHYTTANSLNNLAFLYQEQGQYEQAEPLLKESFQIYEKSLGRSHPDTAQSLNNLAGLYHYQGNYEKTELLCKESLSITEKALGWHHKRTTTMISNLVVFYFRQGRRSEALPYLQKAMEILKKESESQTPNLTVLEPIIELFEDLKIPPFDK